jgi:hypothetical protein
VNHYNNQPDNNKIDAATTTTLMQQQQQHRHNNNNNNNNNNSNSNSNSNNDDDNNDNNNVTKQERQHKQRQQQQRQQLNTYNNQPDNSNIDAATTTTITITLKFILDRVLCYLASFASPKHFDSGVESDLDLTAWTVLEDTSRLAGIKFSLIKWICMLCDTKWGKISSDCVAATVIAMTAVCFSDDFNIVKICC